MKNKFCTAMLVAFATISLSTTASANWIETLLNSDSYEAIPAPEALNAPVQDGSVLLLDNPTQVEIPSQEYYVPAQPMSYQSHSPVVPLAPHHYHAPAPCCKPVRVSYMNHPILAMLLHKCKTGEAAQVLVQVPTACCVTEVKVCVPLCCVNVAPQMKQRCDLLGRCVFEFCWPCGTKIKVVRRHTGDLVVHSYEL